jgi:hypothetical protein
MNMKMRLKHSALAASIALVVSGAAYAERLQWKTEDGGNDHWYERVNAEVTWHQAKQQAEDMGGHLATITSDAENTWVYDNFGGGDAWLGATDEGSEGTWIWVTGEPWGYTRWASNQPDNAGSREHYLHYRGSHPAYTWNDWPTTNTENFIVEYEGSDCDPVIYSSTDKKITFDTLAMELYNPITDEPNGQFALFSGAEMSLKALPGFYDFQYEGGAPSYADELVEDKDNCYPTFSAKEETVHFPKVEIPLVGALPDGSLVDGPAACYETLFRQSTTQAGVFSLKEVTEIACE